MVAPAMMRCSSTSNALRAAALVGTYESGNFIIKRKMRDLPFEAEAKRTLDVVMAAATE